MGFSITKDLSPDKITDYTFQGQPITLAKVRGKPPNSHHRKTWYSIESKVHAACIYAVTGSIKQASEVAKVPQARIKEWQNEQWWIDTIKQVRREENDTISAKMTQVIEESLDQMLDRLKNGNIHVSKTTGETYTVPVPMRDLAMPVGILTDKRQLLRGEATSISGRLGQEEILKELANKFEGFAKQLNLRETVTLDVTDAEVIQNGETKETGETQTEVLEQNAQS